MSQELLKRLVLDSESQSSKYTQKTNNAKSKTGKSILNDASKKLKKKEKSLKEINKKYSKILGDQFKSLVKKMKVSSDKNLILEKNLQHLSRMQQRGKVAESVISHLVEKVPQKF
jgi:hypothetical protein